MNEIYIPLLAALAGVAVAAAIGYGLGYRAGCRRVARHVHKVTISPSMWGAMFEDMKHGGTRP